MYVTVSLKLELDASSNLQEMESQIQDETAGPGFRALDE